MADPTPAYLICCTHVIEIDLDKKCEKEDGGEFVVNLKEARYLIKWRDQI